MSSGVKSKYSMLLNVNYTLWFHFSCLSVEKFSLESRLQKCESDYEQRLSIANDQVESLQKELQKYKLKLYSFMIWILLIMCSSRKCAYSRHRRDCNFLGGGGFCKNKTFKENHQLKLNWNFQWGGRSWKNPFRGGGYLGS